MLSGYGIASIVARAGGFGSRKRLQRYFYFLDVVSGLTGLKFELNRYGPYSRALSAWVEGCRLAGYLDVEQIPSVGFAAVVPTGSFLEFQEARKQPISDKVIFEPYEEQLRPIQSASHDLLDWSATLQYFFSKAQDLGLSSNYDAIAAAQRHNSCLWDAENLYQARDFLRKITRNDNLYVRPLTDPEPNL